MDVRGFIALLPEWETAQAAYLQTKDPSVIRPVADGLDQLCTLYLEADPTEREAIRQAFDSRQTLRNALIGHIYRAASRIESAEDSHWLLVGLAAASIEDQRTDYRDTYVALGELYLAAVRAGIDNSPHFKKVAALSSGKAQGGRNTRGFIGGFRRSAYFKESVASRVEFAKGAPGLPVDLPAITPDNADHVVQLGGFGFPPGFIVYAMSWSPDGTILAMGRDRTICLYDTNSLHGEPRTLGGRADLISDLTFDASGRFLASCPGSAETDIVIWNVASGAEERIIRCPDAVYALAFGSRDPLLASGGRDKHVRLWNAATGEPVTDLEGHHLPVKHLQFNPDDTTLVSSDDGPVAFLWDVERRSLRATMQGDKKGCMRSTSFSADGSVLATTGSFRTIRLWNTETGELIEEFDGGKGKVTGVAFSPDGAILASCSTDKRVRLWEYETRKLLVALKGHNSGVHKLVFNQAGTVLASLSVTGGTVRFWGVRS